MMNFVTLGVVQWESFIGCFALRPDWINSISHRPILCKMKCTFHLPSLPRQKSCLSIWFSSWGKGSFTSKVSFPPKSLVLPCLPKINMFSHLLALEGWVVSPSPQRAGAQCGPLTVVKGLSPCGPVWILCLGSVCNYLGKVFISPPLSNPLTYIFPSVLLSSLSVFHLSLLSFTFFSPVSVQTPLSKGNTRVCTHMSERS